MKTDAVSLDFARRPSALTYMSRGVLPVRRHANLAPEIRARWTGHRAHPRDLAEFRRIAGLGPDDGRLPLLYPHMFGFRLAMAILTHPKFPVPIWGVLQIRNHLEQLQPIATDASLDFETRVMRGRVVAKGAEFDLHTTVHVGGVLAWHSDLTFFTRGRFGEPEPAAPLSRAPTEFGPQIAEWTMRDADHFRVGRYTGDYNGIHLWDWYARRMGFRRALYHPPRVLGQCLAHLPRLGDESRVRLDAWLKGPVSHGAHVRLHALAAATSTSFALFADDERPCFVGRLQSSEATT
jgi:acyl dehydratase